MVKKGNFVVEKTNRNTPMSSQSPTPTSRGECTDRRLSPAHLRRHRLRRLVTVAAVTIAAVILVWWTVAAVEPAVTLADARLATVETGPLEAAVSAQGRIEPQTERRIITPITTTVTEILVRTGDTVRAGQPLVRLDLASAETEYGRVADQQRMRRLDARQQKINNATALAELRMQIRVKEMAVERQRVEVENERRLDSLGSGTGDRVRQAETAYASGELELEQLRMRLDGEHRRINAADASAALSDNIQGRDVAEKLRILDKGRMAAPVDGVLTYIVSETGGSIAAGTCVAVVSDLSRYRVEGEVSESQSNLVQTGSEVELRIGGEVLRGTVTNVDPEARGGTVRFGVALADSRHPRLRSGLRVEMQVKYGYRERVTRIPLPHGFKGRGEYSIFVLEEDSRLVRRTVTLGDSNSDHVEVVDGLEPGERVALGRLEAYENRKSLKIK